MDLNEDEICSICFEKDNGIIPARTVRELTETLFIDLDDTSNENFLLCQNCVKEIHKAYDFKMVCLYAEEILSINQCRLCKSQLDNNVRNYLTNILENAHMKEIFEKHIPELDLWATSNHKICKVCLKSLFSFHNLLLSLHARKLMKLATNVDFATSYEKSIPELSHQNLFKKQRPGNNFTIRQKAPTKKMSKYKKAVKTKKLSKEDTGNKLNTIQCDKCHFETEDPKAYENHRNFLHTEKFDCSSGSFSTEIESILYSRLTRNKMEDIKKDNKKSSNASKEDTGNKINTIQCDKCHFETEDPKAYEKHRNFVHIEIHHCQWCSFSTEIESCLHSHLSRHKIEEINHVTDKREQHQFYIHECELCNFQTLDTEDFKAHIDQHMPKFL